MLENPASGKGAVNLSRGTILLVDITGESKTNLNGSGAGLNASSIKKKLTWERVVPIVNLVFDPRIDGTRKNLKIRL